MFILYVLECMLLMLLGGDNLISTNKPRTEVDAMVGFFGWIILISLVCGILLLVKYSRNKYRLKKKWKEEKTNPKKRKIYNKKDIRGWIIFFCCSVLVFVAGIIITVSASNGSTAESIGAFIRRVGIMMTTASVLIPLFIYLWRKLDV